MTQGERAISLAITLAKDRGREEVTADDLLLAGLQIRSEFGIAHLGPWKIDLEDLGVDWLRGPAEIRPKVAYSDDAVGIFDRAAAIARVSGTPIDVTHLLAAFAGRESGLMGELSRKYGITSAGWRAALAGQPPMSAPAPSNGEREFMTAEEAAESLGVHVQTLRAYIRSGKLPAMRLAGERALRIRRSDLEKAMEPLVPGME
jgi:excisionase family DNA binding protein